MTDFNLTDTINAADMIMREMDGGVDIPQGKKDVRYQYRVVGGPDTNGNRKTVPAYKSKKSRRFETIGLITRICDLAGFELAERVVLKDKETGEILR